MSGLDDGKEEGTWAGADKLFLMFVLMLFSVLLLYGTGMVITILWGDETLAGRLISGFSGMFVAVLGFGTGYLLGRGESGRKR